MTDWKNIVTRLIGGYATYAILSLSLLASIATASVVKTEHTIVVLLTGFALSVAIFGIAHLGVAVYARDRTELAQTRLALAQHTERLRVLHEIDRAVVEGKTPDEIAGAAVQPLRELLGVPRAVVNLFNLESDEVEWLAAAGRHRVHVGPGIRYSMRFMGDTGALKRGEPQLIDTRTLPAGPEVDALLASGVETYMVVPMIAGGELIGGISFGGSPRPFPSEQIAIAKEIATQFAIAITQARLYEKVKQHAEELEERVQERTNDLQLANKELEAFSYSVAHDLRGPLRGIEGFSQILLEDYKDVLADEGKNYLQRIRIATQRMSDLIDDLLELAKVSRVELWRQPVNLSLIAADIFTELGNAEPGRSVQVEIEPGMAAFADKRLLRVVLTNLLGNAWKFTARSDEARIHFGSEARDGTTVYYVHDNGAGFDMKYAEKLFRPFQRLHTDVQFTGTGIGLATAHRIISRHGGTLWAEGAVDQGATFFFTLPASIKRVASSA